MYELIHDYLVPLSLCYFMLCQWSLSKSNKEIRRKLGLDPVVTRGSRTSLFILLFVGGFASASTPAREVQAALADLKTLPAEKRPFIRYLSMHGTDPLLLEDTAHSVSYVLNAMGHARKIFPVARRGDYQIIRIDIRWYATDDEQIKQWIQAWENLANRDPYFHKLTTIAEDVKVQKLEELKPDKRNGEELPKPGVIKAKAKKIRDVVVDSGVDPKDAAELRELTGSVGAVLRADWFIANAFVTPSYYEFAGVPEKLEDFYKSIGLDINVIRKLEADTGANLGISNVTFKPRRVISQTGPLGRVYITYDVNKVTADRDFIRRPINADGLKAVFDAREIFGKKANGLWLLALYDSADRRQNEVPQNIVAQDQSEPHANMPITPGMSCIRCHVESGLRTFTDDQLKLLTGPIQLNSYRSELVQRLLGFHDPARMAREMAYDREDYDAAVNALTFGALDAKQMASTLAFTFRRYAVDQVTPEQAAVELGVGKEDLKAIAAGGQTDIHFARLASGDSILRATWESSFPEAIARAEIWRAKK